MDKINVVWENTVDSETFKVSVIQPNKVVVHEEGGRLTFDDRNSQGTLKVEVMATGEILLEEEVSISHGAIFGPDVRDVDFWQRRSLEVIDAWIEKQ